MREKATWKQESTSLGHTYHLAQGSETWLVKENMETDWTVKNRNIRRHFWFRSPRITLSQLETTIDFLSSMDGAYNLEVWATQEEQDGRKMDVQFDASLKISDATDAAMVGWSLTETWMKWNQESEKELRASLKPRKPLKATMDRDGNVRIQGRVTQTTLGA